MLFLGLTGIPYIQTYKKKKFYMTLCRNVIFGTHWDSPRLPWWDVYIKEVEVCNSLLEVCL